MKTISDTKLIEELWRIVHTIQAKRHSIHDDKDKPILSDHPKFQLWYDLLDVEYYALESLQDMGVKV